MERLPTWSDSSARMPMRSAPLTVTRAKTFGGVLSVAVRTLTRKSFIAVCIAQLSLETLSAAMAADASPSGKYTTAEMLLVPLTAIEREPPSCAPWPITARVKSDSAAGRSGPMAVATTLRDIDLVLKSVLGAAERCRMLFNMAGWVTFDGDRKPDETGIVHGTALTMCREAML